MAPERALVLSRRLFAYSGLIFMIGLALWIFLDTWGLIAGYALYGGAWYGSIKSALVAIANAHMSAQPDQVRSEAIERIIMTAIFPIVVALIVLYSMIIT